MTKPETKLDKAVKLFSIATMIISVLITIAYYVFFIKYFKSLKKVEEDTDDFLSEVDKDFE